MLLLLLLLAVPLLLFGPGLYRLGQPASWARGGSPRSDADLRDDRLRAALLVSLSTALLWFMLWSMSPAGEPLSPVVVIFGAAAGVLVTATLVGVVWHEHEQRVFEDAGSLPMVSSQHWRFDRSLERRRLWWLMLFVVPLAAVGSGFVRQQPRKVLPLDGADRVERAKPHPVAGGEMGPPGLAGPTHRCHRRGHDSDQLSRTGLPVMPASSADRRRGDVHNHHRDGDRV